MRIPHPIAFALLLISIACPALAESFDARVTRVKDGDSIVVYRPDVKRSSEIRFAGIDAPELAQPWGIQSRSALRRLVHDKPVRIEVTDRDRYGRLVGRVWQGRTYVNAAMVEQGHAWAFRRYYNDKAIREAQKKARAARRGLWSLPKEKQVPPATWRERHPRSNG